MSLRRETTEGMRSKTTTKTIPSLMIAVLSLASCTAGPLDVVDNTLLRGLVAHWSFDEGGGTLVTDRSGNGHHGTLRGGTWIPGHFDGALHFEQGDEVAVPLFPSATAQWTVGVWVRPPSDDLGETYISLVSTELVFSGGWEMNARLSGLAGLGRTYQFGYYLGPGDSDYYTHNCACVSPQQWTHIVGVVNSNAGTLAFYRDGLPERPVAMPPAGATPGPIKPGSDTLYMGRWSMPGRLFKGDLDDVVVYDRALAPDEVAALARSAVPGRR